jgi:hypothetical protein
MRTFHRIVFDDNVDGTTAVYSSPRFDALLGLSDALSLSGYAVSATGSSPTLSVQVEQSPDRQRWTARNGTAEISAASLSTTAETTFQGNDGSPVAATRPGFARLKITLGGSTPRAHVKIWVTGRGEMVLR